MYATWLSTLGPMAQRFFQARDRYISRTPQFQCPDSCSRPCCTGDAVHANVTLFDILAASAESGETPLAFFQRYIELGVEVLWDAERDHPLPHLWRLHWRLRRSCPMLSPQGKCRIHAAKPLGCREFPELPHLFQLAGGNDPEGLLELYREQGEFACFNESTSPGYLRGHEGDVADLSTMTLMDEALSNLLFFFRTPAVINITPNIEEIGKLARVAPETNNRRLRVYNERAIAFAGGQSLPSVSEGAVLSFVRRKAEPNLRKNALALLSRLDTIGSVENMLQLCVGWATTLQASPIFVESARDITAVLEPDRTLTFRRIY